MKHILLIASLFLYTAHTTHAMEIAFEPSYQTLQCLEGIKKKDVQQVKESLLEHADVNYTDNNGKSLFYWACATPQKLEIMLSLVTHKDIDLMARSAIQNTPLHIACSFGLPETVESMLSKNPQLTTMRNKWGETPLMLAAASTHKDSNDCVKLLISSNKNTIDWKSSYSGSTALHFACQEQQYSKIKELIINGANPIIKTNNQTTPLILFYCYSDNNNYKNYYNNGWDLFRSFLTENCNQLIHTTDTQKNTQFHLCATIQDNFIIATRFDNYLSFLAYQKLDINARNDGGKRAVDLACEEYTRLYNLYKTNKLPDIYAMVINQEEVMYAFLRFISPNTQCALFTHLLEQPSFCKIELVKDIKAYIMSLYYALNIETIIAKKYKHNINYYNNSIEYQDKIRKQLLEKPEPQLLWNAL